MIYVGVVARLLSNRHCGGREGIRKQFSKKVKAANLNLAAVKARIRLRCGQPYQSAIPISSSAWTKPPAKSLSMETQLRLWAAWFAGATMVAWYPITPSSSLAREHD